ncbi:MAG: hypothetical protein VX929_05805 [Pseudomonadota bacterium]|nr:hypothetical protein [Pseudomonadota bacterium]
MPSLRLIIFTLVLAAAGCAANKPVIYPNTHSQSVGTGQVEADIAACKQLAESAGASPYGGNASDSARAAVHGGAIGGSATRGAKIGAASGATASLLHAFFKKPRFQPNLPQLRRALLERSWLRPCRLELI